MEQMSLILAGLIVGMIALQIYRRSRILIKAKNTVVEKSSLGISFGMIAIVTLFGASKPEHYLVGVLLAGLVFSAFAKTGITETGLNAMSRIFMTLPWQAIRFAKVIRRTDGQEFVIHSVGKLSSNVMSFDMKDYDRALALLEKNLGPDRYEIAEEKPVEGLRDVRRKGREK